MEQMRFRYKKVNYAMKVLEVKGVSKNFYSTHALTEVSFDL